MTRVHPIDVVVLTFSFRVSTEKTSTNPLSTTVVTSGTGSLFCVCYSGNFIIKIDVCSERPEKTTEDDTASAPIHQ